MTVQALAGAMFQSGRGRVAGVGLLVVLVLMLWIALRSLRGGDHPLAAVGTFDLCARLGPQVWHEFGVPSDRVRREIPGFGRTRSATCYLPLDLEEGGPAPARHAWIVVTTHQMLAADGNRAGSQKYVESWLAEAGASGSQVDRLEGPWRVAGVVSPPRVNGELQVLADDHGVVLWIVGRGFDRATLSALAVAAARRLREVRA